MLTVSGTMIANPLPMSDTTENMYKCSAGNQGVMVGRTSANWGATIAPSLSKIFNQKYLQLKNIVIGEFSPGHD